MIYREGGFIDPYEGPLAALITYDAEKQKAILQIKDRPGQTGKALAVGGVSGEGAKRFYDRLNHYFFGYDRN